MKIELEQNSIVSRVLDWVVEVWENNDHFRRIVLGTGIVGILISIIALPNWVMGLVVLGVIIYLVGMLVDKWQ